MDEEFSAITVLLTIIAAVLLIMLAFAHPLFCLAVVLSVVVGYCGWCLYNWV